MRDAACIAIDRASEPGGTEPAVLLVDAGRRLLCATPAARARLGPHGALDLVHGALVARDEIGAARLQAAFGAVISGADAMRTLRLGDDGARTEVLLVPLHGDGGAVQVMVTLRALSHPPLWQLDRAARRFGLTRAESRLLAALCEGLSLAQASHTLGVARTTVRTHLQRIFDKSGTHRQAELVRLVFAG